MPITHKVMSEAPYAVDAINAVDAVDAVNAVDGRGYRLQTPTRVVNRPHPFPKLCFS